MRALLLIKHYSRPFDGMWSYYEGTANNRARRLYGSVLGLNVAEGTSSKKKSAACHSVSQNHSWPDYKSLD